MSVGVGTFNPGPSAISTILRFLHSHCGGSQRLAYDFEPAVGPPTDKDDCKRGGWQELQQPGGSRNQGECVRVRGLEWQAEAIGSWGRAAALPVTVAACCGRIMAAAIEAPRYLRSSQRASCSICFSSSGLRRRIALASMTVPNRRSVTLGRNRHGSSKGRTLVAGTNETHS